MELQWTREDLPELRGKTALVTGANSGLGFEITKALASRWCRVIMGCRNMEKAHEARKSILKIYPGAVLDIIPLDLASLHSVEAFATSVKERYSHLDFLFNNGGIMIPAYQKTCENFEFHFGVNYLAHFALTLRLLPLIVESPGCRVIHTGSRSSGHAKVYFNDLNFEEKYDYWKAYTQSKLAQLMFGLELNRKFRKAGIDASSMVAHPGFANTGLFRSTVKKMNKALYLLMRKLIMPLVSQSRKQGILPLLYAATAREAHGGGYYGPDGSSERTGYPAEADIPGEACRKSTRKKLWKISEKMTGLEWHFKGQFI